MHVTLVYPSIGVRVRAPLLQPLTMAALAGLAPADVAIRFYDDRLEEIPFDVPTDLVGISVQTFTAKRAYEIAAEFRRRKVPVVLGGFHVTALPDEAAERADTIAIGQAEELWPRVLEDTRTGRLQRVYLTERREENWTLLCGRTFTTAAAVNWASLGLCACSASLPKAPRLTSKHARSAANGLATSKR